MKNSRIEYIDFAKGFAILAIVLFHYLQPFSSDTFVHSSSLRSYTMLIYDYDRLVFYGSSGLSVLFK
jgi:fucose 4-O-acetylase-like acetyltransferase